MSEVEQVKNQAAVLSEFMATVGKKLKHTHALEAVARLHGYSSWVEFKTAHAAAESSATRTLADMFRSRRIGSFVLGGIPCRIMEQDMEALNLCLSLSLRRRKGDPTPTDEELNRVAVRICREGGSAQDVSCVRTLTVGDLLYATSRGQGWVLGADEEFVTILTDEVAGTPN